MQDTASKRDGPLILAGCYCLKQDLSDSPKQLIQVIQKVTSHGSVGEGRKEESKWVKAMKLVPMKPLTAKCEQCS